MYIEKAIYNQRISLSKNVNYYKGFTLIELMVTLAILSIIAAIAIPSYRNQIRLNSEEQARTQMLMIAQDLSSHRSKTLSYRGFIPQNEGCSGSLSRCYSESDGTIYVPLGSNSNNYKYKLVLVDGAINTRLDENSALGRSWSMIATPNPNDVIMQTADTFRMNNLGVRTATSVSNTTSPW